MTARALNAIDVIGTRERELAWREALTPHPSWTWDPQRFAEEQLRGLVRQVFSESRGMDVRQVAFSAIDSSTDVAGLCRRVGEMLATEKRVDVAIVGAFFQLVPNAPSEPCSIEQADGMEDHLKETATRLGRHCWLLDSGERICSGGERLHTFLRQIRQQFDYSIVAAPAASESDVAMAMSRCADGIILIVSAQQTRRAAARTIKEKMDEAHVRLLGAILSDREFPIPHSLYCRL